MSAVEFMSAEHVAAMNALLEDAPSVRKACSELPVPRVMAYRLADGPDGGDVHWAMTFTDTVRFSLQEHPEPDVCFVGDWTKMILASQGSREGEPQDPNLTIEGDAAVLAEIGAALEVARSVATVPVDFPIA